jgi:hypothetical protein
VASDFNTILYNSKKRGGICVREPMWEKMEYLISDWDLQDIKPVIGKYNSFPRLPRVKQQILPAN